MSSEQPKSELKASFAGGLFAITLFVQDLNQAEEFYGASLGLDKVFGDDVSAVYMVGSTAINLLLSSEAADLVAPFAVASPGGGAQSVYTLRVKDVDRVVEQLLSSGVALLNGPIDRPWGVRTASFQDPSGNIWELADHA
jgi:catechol 2,3-dioxygenase-like lactoylglutathione lyase family enzyme